MSSASGCRRAPAGPCSAASPTSRERRCAAPLLILLSWAVLGGVMVLLFDHQAKTERSSELSAGSGAADALQNVH